jgi:type VI secretion system protein ImpL
MSFPLRISPPLLLLLIAIAIVLIFASILVVLWRTRKKQEEEEATAGPKPIAASAGEAPAKMDEPGETALSTVRTEIQPSGSLRFPRTSSPGMGGRYHTPWFLILGASGSGKSTLLEHSGLGFSSQNGAENSGASGGIRWNFFDGAVVLDVPGESFVRESQAQANGPHFKSLLQNLIKHRPQRPIDGVVLTIPCSQLLGPDALSAAAIEQQAAQIQHKLGMMEEATALSFPVYVIITKCDLIPGFTNFAGLLPSRCRREMFGWSNPHAPDAPFEPDWIDQGFEELARQLSRLQGEIFIERRGIPDAAEVFLFSDQLRELSGPLRLYLDRILKRSVYSESLQFRGFYFTGDASAEIIETSRPQRALAVSAAHSYSSSFSSSFDVPPAALSAPGSILGLTSAPSSLSQAVPIFVTDLFESKIFPERNLARPVSRIRLTNSRLLLAAQAASWVAGIGLMAGLSMSYGKLAQARDQFVPMLNKVYEELTRAEGTSGQLNSAEEDRANRLVRTAQSASGSFRTIFYPTSLIAPIEPRLQRAMVPVFEELIYKGFRQQLLKKAILDSPTSRTCTQDPNKMPSPLASYRRLCAYTTNLLTLEANIDTYNTISRKGEGDIRKLSDLEAYLSGAGIDEKLQQHGHIFDLALAGAVGKAIGRADVNQNDAASTMRSLVQSLLTEWFPDNPLLQQVDAIRVKIDELDGAQTSAELSTLEEALGKVKAELAEPQSSWAAATSFTLTPELSAVTLDPIDKSKYFLFDQSEALRSFITETGKTRFEEFRAKRDGERSRLTGALLQSENGLFRLADNADKLRGYLADLLKQPFAQHDLTGEIKDKAAGQQLIWNKDLLHEAAGLQDQYESFIKNVFAAAPSELQETFQTIAMGRLADNILQMVSQAEKFEPSPASPDADQELLSFQNAATSLDAILGQLRELDSTAYQTLLKITSRQASTLLARLDSAFEAQIPYATNGTGFNRWTGENSAAWAGFDVHSADEVSQYLAFQRGQVQQYASKAAPLVNFLETKLPSGSKDSSRIFAKWRDIVDQMRKIKENAPGTALANLEDFIGVQMGKITPENCRVPALTTAAFGGSYFAKRQEVLRSSLYNRCRFLSEQNAIREYGDIAALFNERLAGRFPFAPPPEDQNAAEADPQDIVKLYAMLDGYGQSIRTGLQKGDFGDSYAQVLNFLTQMDGLRPIFVSFLSGQPDALPAFDIVPEFRVNRDREINGNQIIDWSLQAGAESFHYPDPQRTGRWNFGEPVKLTLRWAKNSPQQPAAPPTDNASLNDLTLTFEYRDSWSLLRMILLHHAASNDFARLVDPDPQTLVFSVANSPATNLAQPENGVSPQQTKVFIRIRLRPPGKPDNLRVKTFPTEAPILPQPQTSQTSAGGNPQ